MYKKQRPSNESLCLINIDSISDNLIDYRLNRMSAVEPSGL